MREHYNIDRLIEHGCEPIPDTARVVNPHWKRQVQLMGAAVFPVDFGDNRKAQDLSVEALGLCVVPANDGDVMDS